MTALGFLDDTHRHRLRRPALSSHVTSLRQTHHTFTAACKTGQSGCRGWRWNSASTRYQPILVVSNNQVFA